MREDNDTDAPHPLLACRHPWDEAEDWSDMAVILKETPDGPDGPQPAISTGHFCRACRVKITGERFASLAEAEAWLRQELASRATTSSPGRIPSPDMRLRDLPLG